MKNLYLLSALLLFITEVVAQPFVTVTSPANIQNSYSFTNSYTTDAWGADLTTGWWTGETVVALDGTVGDSLVCQSVVNTGDVSGKIALVYRGDCNFSIKAYNAQLAGAIACVIINNEPGLQGMLSGINAEFVTIPVVQITMEAGALITDEMMTSTVIMAIGNPQDVFTTNLGSGLGKYNRNRYASVPAALAESSVDHYMVPTIRVNNWGSDLGGIDASVSAVIDRDGTVLYTENQTMTIPYGDSVQFDFPSFWEANGLQSGYYTVTYTITPYDGQSPVTDEFPHDNVLTTNYWINDEGTYSKSRVDPIEGPRGSSGMRPANSTEFEWCIHLQSESAEGQSIQSITFATLTNDIPLTGEAVMLSVYEWNDPAGAFTFDDLNELTDNEFYDYTADLQNEFVTHTLSEPVPLQNDQKYLACATIFTDDMFLTVDQNIDYSQAYTWYVDEAFFPLNDIDGGAWFVGGFGPNNVPAIVLDISCALSSSTTVSECGSYEWNNTTYTQSGSYTYQTTNPDGCDSTATLNLTIIPAIEQDESYTLCSGESVTVNGTTYSQTGQFVQLIPGNNDCDTLLTINVDVDSQPSVNILGNTFITPNSAETYAFVDPGGYIISWSAVNGTVISGQGTPAATIFWDATGGGEVTVTLTNNNCTYSYTIGVGIFVGVENHWLNELSINPNPSSGIFTMNFTEPTTIRVFDGTGRLVLESNGNGLFSLDMSAHPTGTYNVQLIVETGVAVRPIMKY